MARHLVNPDAVPATPSPSRRGRPSGARAAAIDADIRAAARALFLELGYEATSMDAIAARVPVSKGTLYTRYQGKELLFRAVIENEMERFSLEAGANDHLMPDDLEGRLRHHARAMIDLFGRPHYQLFSRMLDSAARTFPDLNVLRQEVRTRHYLRVLVDDLAKTREGGRLPRHDREVLANMFLHAIAGWHRHESALRDVPAGEALAYADRVVSFIARAADVPADAGR